MALHALTDKQQKILLTVAGYFPEGKYKYPLDIDQIVDALPYRTTKASFHFSLRALIAHGLVERGGTRARIGGIDNRKHRVILLTEDGWKYVHQLMPHKAAICVSLEQDEVLTALEEVLN